MKKIVLAGAVLATLYVGAKAADVGVAIQFSQPGAYGRVDIGQFGPPQVIAPQPVLIAPPPPSVPAPEPVYLWVPPGHREHWARYCHEYHACGHPVYFVDHDWYDHHVMHHEEHERGHGHEHDRDRERGDHDRHD